jgi:hypothetical protein
LGVVEGVLVFGEQRVCTQSCYVCIIPDASLIVGGAWKSCAMK